MVEYNSEKLYIYDFHSHILPELDDGARDTAVSKELLDVSSKMGIDGIVATPHFYATENRVGRFLENRAAAVERILTVYDKAAHPRVYLGAEVAYFYGIGSAKDMERLTIEGTKILLVEMPYATWNDNVLAEIRNIRDRLKLTPVIAHMERYYKLQSKKTFKWFIDNRIDMQFNASFLADAGNRRAVGKLIKAGAIHMIGSDCHNIGTRPQNLISGIEMLEQYSHEALRGVCELSQAYLRAATPIA